MWVLTRLNVDVSCAYLFCALQVTQEFGYFNRTAKYNMRLSVAIANGMIINLSLFGPPMFYVSSPF